jgi:F-type H+-transporting ATPase subunit a
VPRGVRSVLEIFIVFIRDDVARRVIPEHADRYVGLLLTTFLFILTCNLLGLVPGMATATGAISVTAALALVSFTAVQSAGIRQYGVIGHFRNLVPHGLPAWLVPVMIVVEFLGMLSRPFALCVRLFANMTAGHVIIISLISIIFIFKSAWMSLLSVPFVLFIDVLELLVAVIQAFIFTMLTALFIGLAVHPAH